jgi:hypothetical protein
MEPGGSSLFLLDRNCVQLAVLGLNLVLRSDSARNRDCHPAFRVSLEVFKDFCRNLFPLIPIEISRSCDCELLPV